MSLIKKPYIILSCLGSFLINCDSKVEQKPLFSTVDASKTGIGFTNTIITDKRLNPVNNLYVYNGGGVGVADVNNDGLPDIFFSGNNVSSKLYLNKGGLKFFDATQTAGLETSRWCTGVSMVDINGDGYVDIYVSVGGIEEGRARENLLYINNRNGTFTERAEDYGLNVDRYTTQAVFFDYDKDGDLDVYMLNNGIDGNNNLHPIRKEGEAITTDMLFRNNGDDTFTDVSAAANISIEGYGLGIGILDVNNDSWPDIYCSNDFISNDLLYVNNGDGTFSNRIDEYFAQTSQTGMGLDIADFNNDQYLDIVQVDMLPDSVTRQKTMVPSMNYNKRILEERLGYMPQFIRNTLQLNTGLNRFSEIGRLSGVYKTDWSWAPLFFDMDNDGFKDLFISNGYGKDVTDLDFINYLSNPFGSSEDRKRKTYKKVQNLNEVFQPNYFFRNNGDLTFSRANKNINGNQPTISNGASYADLDLDGDLDLIVNNINGKATLYRNEDVSSKSNNYLRVELKGPKKNTFGIGSRVTLYKDSTIQVLEQYPIRGYKSSVEPILHFGLGSNSIVDSLVVKWPDGKVQTLVRPGENKVLKLDYNDAAIKLSPQKRNQIGFLLEEVIGMTDSLVHHENQYNDYERQPLLMQMLSKEGPSIITGDINGDHMEDLILGSAFKDSTFVWIQNQNGDIIKGSYLPESYNHEDQALCLFDFDLDGDLDLYVGSGGNEFSLTESAMFYQDRLYLNDGLGNFSLSANIIPESFNNTSTVTYCDFDKDGDFDLFIGSRNEPQAYPRVSESYILQNNKGVLLKVRPGGFEDLQMVTSSLWTDYNNDGWMDLIVVGEWMPITIYENKKGSLQRLQAETGLQDYNGLWKTIEPIDFDMDGDMDYLVGNHGTNSSLKATKEHPIKLWVKDFDKNGVVDPILGMHFHDRYHTYHNRDDLKNQVPFIGKRFPTYSQFAHSSLSNVFSKGDMENVLELNVNHLRSSLIENLGNGKFKLVSLPIQLQFSQILDFHVEDINSDGYLDFMAVGNRSDNELIGGYENSFLGQIVLVDGAGKLEVLPPSVSGFKVFEDARKIDDMMVNGERIFLIAINNDTVKAYRTTLGK